MITKVEDFICDRIPTKEDVQMAIDIAKVNNSLIQLKWYLTYGGWQKVDITSTTTVEDIMKLVPKNDIA